MRFFHLSDLHIGLRLLNRDLREDQAHILRQIVALAAREQPDAVLIAGDIYDKAIPSAEAVELFDGFIAALTQALPHAAVMLISGNHDSGARVNCFRGVLAKQNLYMIGLPPQREGERMARVTLSDAYGAVHFYLLPFVKPSMVRNVVGTDAAGNALSYAETLRRLFAREEIDPNARNVLVSHQFYLPMGKAAEEMERMDSEMRTVGNIDAVPAAVLAPFDYAALGHIHKPMAVGARARYCGTPLACSVSEAGQQKGVLLAELGEKGTLSLKTLPLTPLREIRILRGTLAEVLAQPTADHVSILLTDTDDAALADARELLRAAFPFLLEIRRERVRRAGETEAPTQAALLDPFAVCCAFLGDLDEGEQALLRDVIHTVQEVE